MRPRRRTSLARSTTVASSGSHLLGVPIRCLTALNLYRSGIILLQFTPKAYILPPCLASCPKNLLLAPLLIRVFFKDIPLSQQKNNSHA